MKTLFIFILMLTSFSTFAITEAQKIEQILVNRGLSSDIVRGHGMEIYMGENSGHIPFAKLKMVITDQELIMKNEIESVDMSGDTISSIKSVRFGGKYILNSDIKAVVSDR